MKQKYKCKECVDPCTLIVKDKSIPEFCPYLKELDINPIWKLKEKMNKKVIEDSTQEEYHLSLLAKAFFKNLIIERAEYGGIGLDDKRPFGNSNPDRDMIVILGLDQTVQNCNYVRKLYHEKLIPYLQKKYGGE